ncbi:hypothetical protein QBC46DRAFT_398396 [Diplogelasinospora grovesii]|uniref:NAD-dependent epimerase/dehydratase domain-containing protein n=1 Tax=Diplogelasinospora grovesii TaxID=303347 RepID=A0AAN6N069_9PEZI|nr:hypothetical protein QBC46DRAFT_398396 [Diplogelasinospora grovesii]
MAPTKLLVTGATGYMGGSFLAQILASSNPAIKALEISALIRKQEQADLLTAKGVKPILFRSLDDVEDLRKHASEHDFVLNGAVGFHTASAKALIEGLGERRKATGQDVYYIQNSGTSNLGDNPITRKFTHPEGKVFSDKENIYRYMREREDREPYSQRTSDLTVIELGKALGVTTHIIMSPMVYGPGLGFFNTRSIQGPTMVKATIANGAAQYIGDGNGVWDHVHISDVAKLYELVVGKIAAGEKIPSGEQGVYFASNGQHSWKEAAELTSQAGYELGALKSPTPVSVSLEGGGKSLGGGNAQLAELGFASRSVTNAELSRSLGWKPQKTEADWQASFKEEFQYFLEKSKA